MSQVGHAVAGALEVSLHAAAVSDCLQGAQTGSGGQIRHAVPQLLWNHTRAHTRTQTENIKPHTNPMVTLRRGNCNIAE